MKILLITLTIAGLLILTGLLLGFVYVFILKGTNPSVVYWSGGLMLMGWLLLISPFLFIHTI